MVGTISDDCGMTCGNRMGSHPYSFQAGNTRNNFISYFNSSAASESWQTSPVTSGGTIN